MPQLAVSSTAEQLQKYFENPAHAFFKQKFSMTQ